MKNNIIEQVIKFKVHSERPYLQPEELFYLKSGYFRTAAEATRAMRDLEELQDGLQQDEIPITEVKECQCTKDNATMDELAELREEVERLKKEVAAVRAFSYRHRHSEWGIAD